MVNPITEMQFNEEFFGLNKHTANGPGDIKYSEIDNQSEHDKNELFALCENGFARGQIPKD